MSSALKFENWIAASWDKSEPGIHLLYGITEWIHRRRSPYQEIVIARVEAFGLGLFLDAVVQLLEADEFVYHEHLVLPALLYHPAPRRVLILGGGDGLALREVLRDPRVESAVMVELDGHVVEVCQEHLAPLHRGSFADPRAQIIIGDARDYLAEAPQRFDVVIVDLVDPYGAEGMALYEEIINSVRRVLAPGGIVSTHGEGVDPPHHLALRVCALLHGHFAHVVLHRQCVSTFSGEWGFIMASDSVDFWQVPTEVLLSRATALRGDLRALIPERFPVAFRLPAYLDEMLAHFLRTGEIVLDEPARGAEWIGSAAG